MSAWPEVRLSPGRTLLALREPDSTAWRRTDGSLLRDQTVEGWTPLVPVGGELTEEVFDKAGPILLVAMQLLSLREGLDTLDEGLEQIDFSTGWGADIRDRAVSDVRDMVEQVRRACRRVEATLPRPVDTGEAGQ